MINKWIYIQGVQKPLRPPGSTLRSNDFTKYFIPNWSPQKTASMSAIRPNIVYYNIKKSCLKVSFYNKSLELGVTSSGSFKSIKSFPHRTQKINKKICVIFKILECILNVSFENITIVSISTMELFGNPLASDKWVSCYCNHFIAYLTVCNTTNSVHKSLFFGVIEKSSHVDSLNWDVTGFAWFD